MVEAKTLAAAPTPARRGVWLIRALASVIRTRLGLTLQQSDALRARTVALRPEGTPAPWELRLTAWSIGAAARVVPGATCLTQALAAQHVLARRGHRSTVRITIPVSERRDLRPHAWLIVGPHIVLGGSREEYAQHRPLLHYEADRLAPIPPAEIRP